MTEVTLIRDISLAFPIERDGQIINTVRMRRAKVRDLEAIEQAREMDGDMAAGIAAISALTNLPADTVRDLDAEDFVKLTEALPAFLPKVKAEDSPPGM